MTGGEGEEGEEGEDGEEERRVTSVPVVRLMAPEKLA